ncbi:hypothetical protein AVEN_176458-1 [Araneus ventricosus]|uniref:Uncharacterized protein n=1 Tax=Araneus ventricosus TaxID=182803 RepID=A0A4Y2VNG8_ARAVE|nr:hypothetical protein AVEN_176458-1 [Araneus ventricosus]
MSTHEGGEGVDNNRSKGGQEHLQKAGRETRSAGIWAKRDKRVARQKESDNVRSLEKCLFFDLLFQLESPSFLLREIGSASIGEDRRLISIQGPSH